jgi:NosR/NirI family nitrous oxide reductase transcriptional regulator
MLYRSLLSLNRPLPLNALPQPPRVIAFVLGLLLAVSATSPVLAQSGLSLKPEQLESVMPAADKFSDKAGTPPVISAYHTNESGEEELIGYLFVTPDLPPEEIGYSAPIEVLVGMDMTGTLTGIEVLYYRESYKSIRGDFLATERFPYQFEDKNIVDDFRVGRDIDGVSRATITSWAVSRGIRNAARRVAEVYLPDSDYVVNTNTGATALQILQDQSWEEMQDSGLVKQLSVTQADGSVLDMTFAFMGHDGLGAILVGDDDYSRADREASNRVSKGAMVLVGIDGDTTIPFRQERLAVEQDDEIFPIERRRFVYVGSADYGKIANRVRFAGAMVLDGSIDFARPFRILYDTSTDLGNFGSMATLDYQVPPVALALAQGTPVPPEYLPYSEDEDDEYNEDNVFASLIDNAPWPETFALLLLLTMVMTSFLRKSAKLRWATLAYTLLYLGFFDGGFVSVSHITNGIKLGPSMFMTDLPMLIIIVFTIITTLFWGRVFCSSLCPFGALQDFMTRFVPKRFQKELPQAWHDKALYIKYGVLAFLVFMALAYSDVSVFQYFEPFGTLFYQSQSVLLWIILLGFLIGSTFISRFYCRYACPLGAALGVTSFLSPFRIKRVTQCQVCKVCEHACPTGAIRGPTIDFKECVRCDVCETKLIAKAGVCKHSVEDLQSRIKDWTPITVS